jgi:thiamine biosynthesis lipoprotein ApbE
MKRSLLSSIAALALICAGCTSHQAPSQELVKANLEAMQEAVPVKVADAQRAARVNKAIDELREQLRSFNAVQKSYQSTLVALNERPDATRAEFEALMGQFDKQRIALRNRVFELHSEMIAATTAEEWKGLYPFERKVLASSLEL